MKQSDITRHVPGKNSWLNIESDRGQPTPTPAFFRIRDVLRITSLTRPTLYRRMAAGKFPLPVHLGGRACAWKADELQAWINDPEGYRKAPHPQPPLPHKQGRPRKYPVE